MAKSNDASGSFYGGYEPALPESHLEDNHATKNGGPELAQVSSGIKGSYGGQDMAVPYCQGNDPRNHAPVGGPRGAVEE